MPILKVDNLTKTFTSGWWPFKTPSTYTAVNNISFSMRKSEILGFLGPNGAGKTTTIQMLLGTLTPTAGSISYFGADFGRHREDFMKIAYKIIGLIIVCFVISYGLVWPFRVSGDCMEPAIQDGKCYFLNRGLPYLRQYRAGDIILFDYENKTWIARIVAVANDTIEINQGEIIVNDSVMQDNVERNWNNWKWGTYAIEKPFKVPEDSVYVLSDNLSAHHDDSRVFGPISVKSISGIVW